MIQEVFAYEITDKAIIKRIRDRAAYIDSVAERYGASNCIIPATKEHNGVYGMPYAIDETKPYFGLVTDLYRVTKPDASVRKNEGLITWRILVNSPLYKEMKAKNIEIPHSEIRKSVGLTKKDDYMTIRDWSNRLFLLSKYNAKGAMTYDALCKMDVVKDRKHDIC
jgi:hypothetical protein